VHYRCIAILLGTVVDGKAVGARAAVAPWSEIAKGLAEPPVCISLAPRHCSVKVLAMETSTLTIKGQVTIPAEVRRRMGLKPGDRVGFVLGDGEVRLVRQETRIEAAFGLVKPSISLTTEQIDDVIRHRSSE
jgi:AbrB family looped-hinge helix DNA binding protein